MRLPISISSLPLPQIRPECQSPNNLPSSSSDSALSLPSNLPPLLSETTSNANSFQILSKRSGQCLNYRFLFSCSLSFVPPLSSLSFVITSTTDPFPTHKAKETKPPRSSTTHRPQRPQFPLQDRPAQRGPLSVPHPSRCPSHLFCRLVGQTHLTIN